MRDRCLGPFLYEPARGLVGFEGNAGYSQRGLHAGRAAKKGAERGQAATVTRTCNLRGGAAIALPISDMAGRCWGLFLLPAVALAQTLTATDFVPYYNYEGDLAVAGTVTVTTDGTSQTLAYSLTGTEFDCAGGANSSLANSCGVHIHSGTSCEGDAGGHFLSLIHI